MLTLKNLVQMKENLIYYLTSTQLFMAIMVKDVFTYFGVFLGIVVSMGAFYAQWERGETVIQKIFKRKK